ncbi:MAG: type II secretion system major pseudopilin GspG [Hydrogenobaculum sp.]
MAISLGSSSKAANKKGFTLIELLVVIVIIGILSAIIIPRITNRIGEAKIKATKVQLKNLQGALEQYYVDTGMYPTTAQGLQALVEKPTIPPIPDNWHQELDKVPTDGWGHKFYYISPAPNHPYDLFAKTPNGKKIDVWTMHLKK